MAESLVTQTLTGRVEGDYRGARVNLTLVGTDVTINDLLVGPDGSLLRQPAAGAVAGAADRHPGAAV
nr:hypothetical protein [Pseudescherichia vulneris]